MILRIVEQIHVSLQKHVLMKIQSKKTKLTLTVRKDIIEKARKKAADRGTSISQLFEEVFREEEARPLKTEKDRALKRFLDSYHEREPVQALPQSDKELYRQRLTEKYG